jgi:23S rRNA (adenine2030-N6)-methyltransferase
MNYRHAYHAGNFADVVKHAVLSRLVEYLKRKEKAFRVIDTHAGAGGQDLSSQEARKTGEWQTGIGRLLEHPLTGEAAALIAPYLDAVRAANSETGIDFYPGSPAIARHLMRKQDRLTAIELHPQDARTLAKRFAGDHQTRVIELDGWLALGAHLPPKEKRGLVLVDPPFEEDGEFARMVDGLSRADRRWPGGIYALWYPIKDRRAVNAFRADLGGTGIPDIIDIRFEIRAPSTPPRLDGSGMVVVNPPYTLEREIRMLLPALLAALRETASGRCSVERIAAERAAPDT